MSVKEHYDNHLGNFYSWILGDFSTKAKEFDDFLIANSLHFGEGKKALDLGAGNGIQTVPLAGAGYQVTAIDFNQQLLNELKLNTLDYDVIVADDDIRLFTKHINKVNLVVCCGDTLTHLSSKSEVEQLLTDISTSLESGGKLIISLRDYSIKLTKTDRFIHVKSEDERILTCFLDYQNDFVEVTDILYEKTNNSWIQKISSYKKLIISAEELSEMLEKTGLCVISNQIINRLTTIIAAKKI